MTNYIGIIGAGNIAHCLINGLFNTPDRDLKIIVSNPQQEALDNLKKNFCNIAVTTDNCAVVNTVDVVILAVKPPIVSLVAKEVATIAQQKKPLFLSVAAGIPTAAIASWLGYPAAIVRCMPNTAAFVQASASGLYANNHVSSSQKTSTEEIIAALGRGFWVDDEQLIDAITAISGSGPAYFFLLMEAIENAALSLGLDKNLAQQLIAQTAVGAASLASSSSFTSKQLREHVTSPGGTTEAALTVFHAHDFYQTVTAAITAAKNKATEIALSAMEIT